MTPDPRDPELITRARSKWIPLWLFGTAMVLIQLEGTPQAASLVLIGPLVALPVLLAWVTAFTHPAWHQRWKGALLNMVLGVAAGLVYWILVDAGSHIRLLDQLVREHRPDDRESIDYFVTSLARDDRAFAKAYLVVAAGAIGLGVLDLVLKWRAPAADPSPAAGPGANDAPPVGNAP